MYVEHKKKAKDTNIEKSEFEERYQDIIDTKKKPPPKKENEVHDTRNNAKEQVKKENAVAAKDECTLAEAEAQETERSKPTGWYSSTRA